MLSKTVNLRPSSLIVVLALASVLEARSSPKFPYGTYVSADGSSEMRFKSDGAYAAYDGGLEVDQGTFVIHGGELD